LFFLTNCSKKSIEGAFGTTSGANGLLTVMDLLYPIEFVPHHWQTREKERNRFVKIWDAFFTVKIFKA